MACWSLFTSFLFAALAQAAIGPSANIVVTNKQLAPDGFTREYVNY